MGEEVELAYARGRLLLGCHATGIEPTDAFYTFSDRQGLVDEVRASRRLGYRRKSLVCVEHAPAVNDVFTLNADENARVGTIVSGFEAAMAKGEEWALVDGL